MTYRLSQRGAAVNPITQVWAISNYTDLPFKIITIQIQVARYDDYFVAVPTGYISVL